jgi:RHH-type proline utilization regulon transcriptional repressor/proline dehydrogenase/delta 1-pyrroline-5-carboxylate dehydrogenase
MGTPVELAGLRAESNVLRHLPLPGVVLRVQPDADPVDVELCELAARTVGTPVARSDGAREPEDRLVERLAASAATRLRVVGGPLDEQTVRAVHRAWVDVMDDPPVAEGRVELRRWVREQSISRTRHRYGVVPPEPGRDDGS